MDTRAETASSCAHPKLRVGVENIVYFCNMFLKMDTSRSAQFIGDTSSQVNHNQLIFA